MSIPYEAESKLNVFLDKVRDEGKESRGDLDRRVSENLDLYRGKNWKGKTAPTYAYNIIESCIADKCGKLSESKPEIIVLPNANGLDKAAELLTNVVTSIWSSRGFEYKTERLAMYGAIAGAAFVGTPFNRRLAGGMGDVDLVVKDPRSCFVDMSCTAAEDADFGEYAFSEDFVPLDLIQAEFPGRGALVKVNERISGYDTSAGAIGAAAKIRGAYTRLFKKSEPENKSAIPKTILEEFYIQDRRKNINDKGVVPIVENLTEWCHDYNDADPFPGGRRILRCGDIILKDEFNPYWDGAYPLDMMGWKFDLESAWGPDEVQGVRRLQEAINRIGDAVTKTMLMNSVSRIVMDTNALSPTERNKLTNEVAQIIEKAPGRAFEYQVPPPLSPETVGYMQTCMDWVRQIMGVTQSPSQEKLPSIITGPAIEGLQLSLQTPIRTAARRIEEFYQRVGNKLVSRVFQFYTSDRLMHMVGPEAKWVKFEFQRMKILQDDKGRPRSQSDMRKAFQDFQFKIEPGSSLAITKTSRAMMKGQLVQMGLLPPRDVLIELGISNPDEKLKQAKDAREKGLMPQADGGKGSASPFSASGGNSAMAA